MATSVQTAATSSENRTWCGWKLLAALPLIAALFVYYAPVLLMEWEAHFGYTIASEQIIGLPDYIMDQFRLYDTNGDGYIDPVEFETLYFQVKTVVSLLQQYRQTTYMYVSYIMFCGFIQLYLNVFLSADDTEW